MTWIKQLSSSTIMPISNKLKVAAAFAANKKSMTAGLAIWLIINIGCYFIFQNRGDGIKTNFFQKGASLAMNLAQKAGPSLLEIDILALNLVIGDISKTEHVMFAAICDHRNLAMAHSRPENINRPFSPLADLKNIEIINDVKINSGYTPDGKQAIGFEKDIKYSGVSIGTVHLGLAAAPLFGALKKNRLPPIAILIITTILLVSALFLMDRSDKKRQQQKQAELENLSQLGPYVLTQKIGQGGMAELHQADYVREDGFRRKVALKKVLPHLAENQDFIKMFIREARLAALLQHPNIVQVMDFGNIKNIYFIAMEYIDGKNLAEIMAFFKTGLPIDLTVFLALQISNGLHYSHTKKDDKTGQPLNIVHRDISPQNILVSFQGEVKLSDFGISKATSEPSFTQAGVIKGKLAYLSPEQALGKEADHQSDIYAFGIVLYEILSGQRLYRFANAIEAIKTIPVKEITPLPRLRSDIPDDLNRIVFKCLRKDKSKRYQSAKQLHDDLATLKNRLNITFGLSDLSRFMRTTFS
ncbi:MAG: protein kinase [Deltaproteobacteria bacterium]|nr:protein kinase [Deltaproteobacteria bacterium]